MTVDKEDGKKPISIIFKSKPESWGLRGDPYLWDELEEVFSVIYFPCSKSEFINYFETYFEKLTGNPFRGDDFEVEKYAKGGMSSGQISMEFWKNRGLQLLISRLEKENIAF